MMSSAKLTIGILGLGQIGGSIAMRLSGTDSGLRILGHDIQPQIIASALELGIINASAGTTDSMIAESDIIVIALPVSDIIEVMKSHATALLAKIAVTDTGSVKGEIVALAEELGLRNFVGAHPLTGTEKRGVGSWNRDLFAGKRFFVTANGATDRKAIEHVEHIVQLLGTTPTSIDPIEHDRLVSLTSSLPHLLAYVLKAMLEKDAAPNDIKTSLCGPSFASATRVAASEPEMVFQMLRHNKQNLSARLFELQGMITEFQDLLDRERRTEFRHFFGC
jgi:prephenate dehydrogenase